jgi:multiple sugar transport system substrate-binding protein
MKGKRRRLSGRRLLAAAVLLLAPLSACGIFSSPSDVDSDTVIVALPSDNPADIELRQTLAKEFMKEHPDIKVQVQVLPSNGYNTKIFATTAAGNPPDIFNSGDIIIPTIVQKDYAYDLHEFVAKENYDLSAFYPEVIDGMTFEGKLVGLTDNWDTQVMYYNRDLFDKAGLDYPDATWTWDDFTSAARQLTSGEGPRKIYGAAHGFWFAPVFDQIWMYGGDVLSKDGTDCVLDSPEAVAAVQSIADLVAEGTIPSWQQLEGQGPLQFLLAGRAAMAIDAGRWGAYELREGRVDWAVAPLPKGPKGRANFFHLAIYAITKNSDNPESAWEFLKFMVSEEAIKLASDNMQGIPSRPDMVKDPDFRNSPLIKEHNTLQPFLESLPTAHSAPYVADFEEYLDAFDVGTQRVWQGNISADEGLTKVCREIEAQIEENQLE